MDAATLIRSARLRAGLTQRDLARRSGTSAPAISLYESGDRIPRVDTLTRLLSATGSEIRLDVGPVSSEHDARRQGAELSDVLSLVDAIPTSPFRPGLKAPVFAHMCASTARRGPRTEPWHGGDWHAIR